MASVNECKTYSDEFIQPYGKPVQNNKVTFSDEKNRSKLMLFLDRVGGYTNFDKDMKLRVFVDDNNDFCAFEAVDYQMSFVSTNHKLIDMISDWRIIEPMSISELRRQVALMP